MIAGEAAASASTVDTTPVLTDITLVNKSLYSDFGRKVVRHVLCILFM